MTLRLYLGQEALSHEIVFVLGFAQQLQAAARSYHIYSDWSSANILDPMLAKFKYSYYLAGLFHSILNFAFKAAAI